jgi:hypothetical protein
MAKAANAPRSLEKGHDEPLHSEAEASGVSDLAGLGLDVEDLAEMILMAIEGAHRSWMLLGDHGHQDFEFQLELALADGEHSPAAAEKGVGRGVGASG